MSVLAHTAEAFHNADNVRHLPMEERHGSASECRKRSVFMSVATALIEGSMRKNDDKYF